MDRDWPGISCSSNVDIKFQSEAAQSDSQPGSIPHLPRTLMLFSAIETNYIVQVTEEDLHLSCHINIHHWPDSKSCSAVQQVDLPHVVPVQPRQHYQVWFPKTYSALNTARSSTRSCSLEASCLTLAREPRVLPSLHHFERK